MAPSATLPVDAEITQSKENVLRHKMNGSIHNGDQHVESHSESHNHTVTSNTQQSTTRTSKTKTESSRSFTMDQQVTVLRDIVVEVQERFISEFRDIDEHHVSTTTIKEFLWYITQERLSSMPQKGSKWDKVLKWAEFFALQVVQYERAVSQFVPSSAIASKLIYVACQALLDLGEDNAPALELTFGAFYKLGLSISFFLRRDSLLHVTAHLRNEVGCAFKDMLTLVSDVAVTYITHTQGTSDSTRLDFTAEFGRQIGAFSARKNRIFDAMWEYELGHDASANVGRIRKWLKPHDKTTRDILRNRREAMKDRTEYTCEWFRKHLLDLSRGKNDVLLVTGPEGCGKSVLSSWIVERLQRPLDKKNFVNLSYSVQMDILGQSTSLEVAKGLAVQLLGAKVGHKDLFEKVSLAYKLSTSDSQPGDVEKALWESLECGLQNLADSDNFMIVVDGIDKITDNPKKTLQRIENLCKKHGRIHAIIMGREISTTNATTGKVQIKPDHVHNDLEQVVGQRLEGFIALKGQSEQNREKAVEQIVHNANGNFLWASLTMALLEKEHTHAAFTKALGGVPKTLPDLMKVVGKVDLQKSDTRLLLQWLLVSNRPLTLAEVKCLYQVDLKNKTLVKKTDANVHDDINACGLLVGVQDGIVAFRNDSIRSYVSKMNLVSPGENLQYDMAMRVLLYCKLSLTKPYQPVCELSSAFDAEGIFRKHPLLEYSVRYWISHVNAASLPQTTKELEFSPEFKSIFPTSTELAVLEWKYWECQGSLSQALTFHDLARRVRQAILTEKHESVLQSVIVCANFHMRLRHSTEATHWFYHASRIGQEVLHKFNVVVINCTKTFLTLTDKTVSTTRTEIITMKEAMLKYIITASKHQHGKSSEIVIQYYKSLAELYTEIHETHHAEQIYEELREIIILRHGRGSEEEKEISQHLVISLKKGQKKEIVEEYETRMFDSMTTMEVWDVRRIKMTFKLALSFEARGEIFLAEEQYILLWKRITDYCNQAHNHCGVEIHISIIDVALEYVRFLIRYNRHQEAAGVLICIWNEYEEYEFELETMFLRLKVVGELMRTVSLLTVAVLVFKKCLSWFKSHSFHDYELSCEVMILETMKEITTTTTTRNTTTSTTSTVTSATTQTVIRDVFESTLSERTVTKETVMVCKNMISLHMNLEQWKEVIEVSKRSLTLIWKMVISGSGTLALPRAFDSEAIDIAISLAIGHYRLHHFYEAEQIYMRIYRACRMSCRIDDERLIKSYKALIHIYEEHHHWHKIINIYQEMLGEYRAHLGATHTLTIKMLYNLGSICCEHGNGNFLSYYEEIVSVLNGKGHICHADARDAMVILCRLYYEEGSWLKLQDVCKILWETWTHHHHEHKFETGFIELLYERYLYVLEYHVHCEYEIVRTLTIQYRNTCLKVFGVLSMITIRAMIQLAQICLRSEKHVHEAISIYEEVITKTTTMTSTTTTKSTTTTTTTVSTTQMTSIKEQLSKAYVKVCSHGSASTTIIERATMVLLERFRHLKVEFGCAHSETLLAFRELTLLYKKLKTQEAHNTVTRLITEVCIEIVKEKHSVTLHEAAITLGGMFIDLGLVDHGRDIILEMRKQVITGTSTSTKLLGMTIEVAGKVSKQSYIFLVTLARVLDKSSSISYSEIMTEMLIEATLYEHYHLCLKSEMDVTVVLSHAARLRSFLVLQRRLDEVQVLEHHAFELFLKRWGANLPKNTNKDVIQIFFAELLNQLGVDTREAMFNTVACIASVETVKKLLQGGKYKAALDISQYSFEFLSHQRAYHRSESIPYMFRLSELMTCREFSDGSKAIEPELYQLMLKQSQTIIREVFKAMKESNILLLRLKPEDLDKVVGLLGAQQNYVDLEGVLKSLWASREVHKTKNWNRSMIISLGRLFAIATCLAHPKGETKAVKVCEDICYNLRRVWGTLNPLTLEMEETLSQVYTRTHHYREAMGVHEEILRLIREGDDGDDNTIDEVDANVARHHINLLQASYVRNGKWDKTASHYHKLVRDVMNMEEYKSHGEFEGLIPAEKWSTKDNIANLGQLVAPKHWSFMAASEANNSLASPASSLSSKGRGLRAPMSLKRVSSNWGLGFLHDLLHGDHEDENDYGHEQRRFPTLRPRPGTLVL